MRTDVVEAERSGAREGGSKRRLGSQGEEQGTQGRGRELGGGATHGVGLPGESSWRWEGHPGGGRSGEAHVGGRRGTQGRARELHPWGWGRGSSAPGLCSCSVLSCLHCTEKGSVAPEATTAESGLCVTGLYHDFPSSAVFPAFPSQISLYPVLSVFGVLISLC